VRVEVFSVGFGRELFGHNDRHGTRWKVSLIPLGGYVRFFGDDSVISNPGAETKEMSPEDKAVCFHHKPLGQRAAIVAAGPMANFLLSIVLLSIMFVFVGRGYTPAVVDSVLPDSAAAEAGFQPGDRVIGIDDRVIERFETLRDIVMFSPGVAMLMTVERDGQQVQLPVTPRVFEYEDSLGNMHEVGRLGISVEAREYVKMSPFAAVPAAVADTYGLVARSLQGLAEVVSGKRDSSELGGPIMIAQMSGKSAEVGFLAVVHFIVLLSASLGLINLFPIPLLDGGHLAFYSVEALRGRPLSMRAQEYGYMVGLALVVTLMLVVTVNDLSRPSVLEFFSRLVG
jgi:regulator of sigma E protease